MTNKEVLVIAERAHKDMKIIKKRMYNYSQLLVDHEGELLCDSKGARDTSDRVLNEYTSADTSVSLLEYAIKQLKRDIEKEES